MVCGLEVCDEHKESNAYVASGDELEGDQGGEERRLVGAGSRQKLVGLQELEVEEHGLCVEDCRLERRGCLPDFVVRVPT